jgi:tetratricopeptide (TPR) repeat protein
VRAFALARTESRLLLTSRYLFALPDSDGDLAEWLTTLQLPPMDAASARKQALRAQGQQPVIAASEAEQQQDLLTRCIELAQGNPGLQDVLSDLVLTAPDVAAVLDAMHAYLARGDMPEQEETRTFLENLALDRLLSLAQPGGGRELLRTLTLFELPVPQEVVDQLAAVVDGEVLQLQALGLVDRFEDLMTPLQLAVAVNAMVKPRVGQLTETERKDHALVLAAWAAEALDALDRRFAFQQAAAWAQQAVTLLDTAGVAVPFGLLRRAGEACVRVGAVEHTRIFYERALEQIITRQAHSQTVDSFEHEALMLAQARLLVQSGEPDAALPLLEQTRHLALQQRAERNAAVVLGDIARLRAQKGEVEEALQLHQEQLAVYERLGAPEGKSATLWDIAQIELNRGEVEKAAPRVSEAYQIVDRLDRLDGICVIGVTLGQLLIAAGERDRGLAVLRRSEQGYRRLQRYGGADRVAALIAKIERG